MFVLLLLIFLELAFILLVLSIVALKVHDFIKGFVPLFMEIATREK